MNKQRKTSHILNVFQYDEATGIIGLNGVPVSGYGLYLHTNISDGSIGIDSSANINALYLLKSGTKQFEISYDTSGSSKLFRLLPYQTGSFFQIGNPSNAGSDYVFISEATYGNVMIGPGLGNGQGNLTGATVATHKIQLNGAVFANSSIQATSFIITGGASTGFLKANGTVDSTTYITSSALTGYATEAYVGTAISNLVASAPATLDTLNELAAALGNDASFASTTATALGNRLRIDVGTQGLTSTQQGYGRTNLGLGSLATLSSIGNSYITDLAYSKLTGVPSTFAPSTHTHVWTDITDRPTNLSSFTNGPGYITGITSSNVTTALGYTPYNSTNPSGYISGITSSMVTTALGYTPYNSTNPNGYITSSASITGTSAGVSVSLTGTNAANLLYAAIADNDFARIRVGGDASNAGWMEIATADDGTEPIYVRQYTGVFSSLTRTATLLDGSGNTSFPGTVTAPTFSGSLSGNASSASSVAWTNVSGRPTNVSSFTNDSGYITTSGESIGTSNTSGVVGAKYQINDTWLRVNSDNRQLQFYGNSRTMIYRTDGNTNDHGGGGYAHIWYYGGSADSQRVFIVNTDGRLYSPYHGWLDTMSVSYASSAGNADTVDGYHGSNYLGKNGNSYYQQDTWISINGNHGIYWPSYYGLHLYPNNDGSYGSLQVKGTKNSWHGIHFDSGTSLMMNSNESGHHREGYGWQFRWSNGSMYVSTNAYGGGSEYTVVHTGNVGSQKANGSLKLWAESHPNDYYIVNNWTGSHWRLTTNHGSPVRVGYSDDVGNIGSAVGNSYYWSAIQYFETNNGGSSVNNSNSAKLQAYSSSNNSAFMSFHRGGYYAINMGLDNDNVFRIGGWSASGNRLQMDMSGNLTMAGDVTAYSDARVKENIVTVDNALNKVLALRGVYYNRIDSDDKKKKIGVIAQETLVVVPEVVNQDNDGMYNVSYGNLAGLFIEAFKEQQKQIEDLKSIIDGLTK